jgi:GrpB-like predicted nucleotidyltransferase (UPF0157 family)
MREKRRTGSSLPLTDEQIRQVTIGEPEFHNGPITLVAYDPTWPAHFEREVRRIREALGNRARRIEHIGSTAVPCLVAKPIIDILSDRPWGASLKMLRSPCRAHGLSER